MLRTFDVFLTLLRPAFFAFASGLAIVCLVDWLVRTRRIRPFSPIARFSRRTIDPLLAPVERVVVRAGGLPASAPLWALAFVVIGGIAALSLLGFVRDQMALAGAMTARGPRGVVSLVVTWTFALLKLAIIVRVLMTWVRVSPYSRWVRWAVVLSEPMLAPLRRVIPPLGMIDISPIVAYVLLSLLQSGVMSLL